MDTFNFNPRNPLVNSQYSPVQIMMAQDEWLAAYDALENAIDAITGDYPVFMEQSYAQREMCSKISLLCENCDTISPFLFHRGKIRSHSSERYPVNKVLKSAAHLRSTALKVTKLQAVQS